MSTLSVRRDDVSPGSTPRPSLSDYADHHRPRTPRVAGVYAPAFVERRWWPVSKSAKVSPGSTPRPSLSDGYDRAANRRHPTVSPGSTPRPSLSDARVWRCSPGSSPGLR